MLLTVRFDKNVSNPSAEHREEGPQVVFSWGEGLERTTGGEPLIENETGL